MKEEQEKQLFKQISTTVPNFEIWVMDELKQLNSVLYREQYVDNNFSESYRDMCARQQVYIKIMGLLKDEG